MLILGSATSCYLFQLTLSSDIAGSNSSSEVGVNSSLHHHTHIHSLTLHHTVANLLKPHPHNWWQRARDTNVKHQYSASTIINMKSTYTRSCTCTDSWSSKTLVYHLSQGCGAKPLEHIQHRAAPHNILLAPPIISVYSTLVFVLTVSVGNDNIGDIGCSEGSPL